MGTDVTAAVPALLKRLKDVESDVRREAVRTLKRMRVTGPEGRPLVEALKQLLRDKDESVAREATLALLEMGFISRAVLRTLVKALADDNRQVRQEALEALKEYAKEEDER